MKEKIVNKINKAKLAITMFMTTTMFPMTAYANTGTGDLTGIVEKVIGWIFNIVAILGVFKLIQGIIDLVSTQDSENADKKEQGTKKIAVGVALIALKAASTIFAGYVASYLQFT